MSRQPKQGEMRGIRILERLEKMFKRPETRVDAQKILTKISANAQVYAKHLVMSGPSSNTSAARDCGLTKAELEAAAAELEVAIGVAKLAIPEEDAGQGDEDAAVDPEDLESLSLVVADGEGEPADE